MPISTKWTRFLHAHSGSGKTTKQLARIYKKKSVAPRKVKRPVKHTARKHKGGKTQDIQLPLNYRPIQGGCAVCAGVGGARKYIHKKKTGGMCHKGGKCHMKAGCGCQQKAGCGCNMKGGCPCGL